ncbi:MAG: alpha-amylase [Halanaerobiales bacterium]
MENEILLQAFYWEMCTGTYKTNFSEECNLWNLLRKKAEKLEKIGFTSIWIPPATKGGAGASDVGYGVYDLWDLGEFEQKGTKRTKYGTKEELLNALKSLHQNNIKVYFDAVLNHRFGADETEVVKLADGSEAEVWTKFNFPGRGEKYSSYELTWRCFDGVDWNERSQEIGKYLFEGKDWDWSYGEDLLMGADLDYNDTKVKEDVIKWGKWIIKDLGFDGFRLDAAKHIDNGFISYFINEVNKSCIKDVFFGGEAWIEDENSLIDYLKQIKGDNLKVFDYPLRAKFVKMKHRNIDMSILKNSGLVNQKDYENRAITFVDTHDTDQDELDDNVESVSHYKYQAYTYILMREKGIPTIYWKDYFTRKMSKELNNLIKARKKYAYGRGLESNSTDHNTYCYIREGIDIKSGLVMLITIDKSGDEIVKEIDSKNPDTTYIDITGNIKRPVITDENGIGNFSVKATENEGWSVWIKK